MRDSVFFLGESELALGNPDSAEKRFATVTSVYPDSPYREACFYRLADIAYRRHDPPGALRRLDQLEKQFPQGSYRGSSLRMRGDIFFDQKRFEEAIAAFEKALSILADGAEKQAAWYSLGLADLMLDRKTRAAEAFGKAGTGLAKDLGEKARCSAACFSRASGGRMMQSRRSRISCTRSPMGSTLKKRSSSWRRFSIPAWNTTSPSSDGTRL